MTEQSPDPAVFEETIFQSLLPYLRPSEEFPLKILLALSGGPDSTAMLLAMTALRDRRQLSCELFACHVNYGLRGADADADEEFCRSICTAKNVTLTVESVQPEDASEARLREIRYMVFEDAARINNACAVLTAHTLDDQIETMLFRLFRGTAMSGLTGIPAQRTSHGGANIVRPLLSLSREAVHDYLDLQGVVARTDASNLTNEYSRNYIRNEIVPRIEQRFPGFRERMDQLREVLASEDIYLQAASVELRECLGAAEDELSLAALSPAREKHPLIRRLLAQEMRKRDVEVSFERVETLLGFLEVGRGSISLDENWDAWVKSERLIFKRKFSAERPDESHAEQKVRIPGQTLALRLGYALRVDALAKSSGVARYPASNSWEALIDLSQCAGDLQLRVRREGDVIIPFGMQETVRLKQFLHTHDRAQAALSLNGNTIVLASGNEVLWVPGVGLSNKLRVQTRPTHALTLMKIAADDVKLS